MGGPCGTPNNRRGAYGGLVGKPEGKKPLGKPRYNDKIILKWIFKKYDGAVLGLIWLGIETSSGLSHGDEPSVSIKCREFID